MSRLDGLRHRLWTLLHPRAHARELDEEMRFHLELDAQHQHNADIARRRFGNRTWYQEEARHMTWLRMLDFVRQDAGYAVRSIARAPGFATLVAITLALGIGINTATFALLDELYLRPPAGVAEPATLRRVWIENVNPSAPAGRWTAQAMHYPDFRTIARTMEGAAELAARGHRRAFRIGRGTSPSEVSGVHASASLFAVLGVKPALGRVYSADEDRLGGAEPVAVVSHAFWMNQLGGDSTAIGQPLVIDDNAYVVVGVLQRGFRGIDLEPVDVWLPMGGLTWDVPRGVAWWDSHNDWTVGAVVARLTSADLEHELDVRATARMREMHRTLGRPDTLGGVRLGSIIETHVPGETPREIEIAKRLAGIAVIVLIIACANVANLLIARALRRRREIAVRLALGISRWRLVRLLTLETLALTLIAMVAALVAGSWGSRVLRTLLMPETEFAAAPLHLRVVAFTVVVALAAAAASGLVPAIQASRSSLTHALKEGGHHHSVRRSRLRDGLVIAQAALSVVLLAGAGLLVRSLGNVQDMRIGFDADRLVIGSMQFADDERPTATVIAARLRDVATRLESTPMVEAVAMSDLPPMLGYGRRRFWVGADSAQSFGPQSPKFHHVSPSFFRATGMRLEHGRGFRGTGEIVVNDATARLLWRGRDALGQCIRFDAPDAACTTVVGVVENARVSSIMESDASAQVYVPLDSTSVGRAGSTLLVRTRPDRERLVRDAVHSALSEEFPTGEPRVQPMTGFLAPQYRPWRLGATLFTALGLLALVVAVLGIYSSVSYAVSQRAHEFGVRIALGARIGNVMRQVLGDGLRIVAIGVLVGIVLALAGAKLVQSLLYRVAPSDPLVLALVALTLLAAAAFAALLPAWRASRVDPLTALRGD